MGSDNDILVSVIMCVYNTPQNYLNDAVLSILKQTHDNFELIIVDDCSSIDQYQDNIFKDKRIVLLKNDKNRGPSYSRNMALEIAKGKYIAIMDSDDVSLPNRLEKQVEFMESNTDVVVAGSWFKFIGNKNHEVKRIIDDNEYYRCSLLFGNSPTLLNPSVIIRKETLDRYHIKYDESLKYGEDYKMWYQLSKVGRITNIKDILLYYRVHDKQATSNPLYIKRVYNGNAVQQEMLDELGLVLSDKEKDMFFNLINSKYFNCNKYFLILDKIKTANKVSKIYDEDKLKLRVDEQRKTVLLSIKNPLTLIAILSKQKGYRKKIIKLKWNQLTRKL